MEQEKQTPISELMRTTMENVKAMADANTIIGAPIQAEGITLIPVSRLSFGVAGGGAEFSTKKQTGGCRDGPQPDGQRPCGNHFRKRLVPGSDPSETVSGSRERILRVAP